MVLAKYISASKERPRLLKLKLHRRVNPQLASYGQISMPLIGKLERTDSKGCKLKPFDILVVSDSIVYPVYIPSPALRGFWWYEISVSGPFGQPGQYIKKKLGADYEQLLRAFFSCFRGPFF